MQLPRPSQAVVEAIQAGATWLKSAAIYDQEWVGDRNKPGGRALVPSPGAGPIWARYYSMNTELPIFGDRDKTIHNDVNELSLERRNGYQWFGTGPQKALDAYAVWSKDHLKINAP
jgi:PelA/Pel-15E family pectate lyase